MKLFDATLHHLENSLDVRLARQNVLSGNLANADTPGFRPRELDFDSAMSDASQNLNHPSVDVALDTKPGDVTDALASQTGLSIARHIRESEAAPRGIDGNAVDVDQALVGISENALQYQAATRAAGKKLAILKYVASDGNA